MTCDQPDQVPKSAPPSEPEHLHHYVVVREDLPPERKLVDVGHACGESVRPECCPLPQDTHLVALSVPDEGALLELYGRAVGAGYDCALIREPDEPWCGAAMAFAIAPQVRKSKLKKLFWGLPKAGQEGEVRRGVGVQGVDLGEAG
jgi:hypothetical protein